MEVENSDLTNLETKFNRAQYLEVENQLEAIKLYTEVINDSLSMDESDLIKEDATIALGKLYTNQKDIHSLSLLLKSARPFFEKISKAKSAKIVKLLIEDAISIPNNNDIKLDLLIDNIKWCQDGKRTFLSYRLQIYYSQILYEDKQYTESMNILIYLIKTLTQIDDKAMLIECYLIQAHIYHDILDYTKSKSCLNQAKMLISTVYIEPSTQCNIDILSGIIASYQHDYINGFAYLQEAYDGCRILKDKSNITSIVNYMVLIKILADKDSEIKSFLQNKIVIDYYNPTIVFLKDVYACKQSKDLKQLEALIQNNQTLLQDPVLAYHLNDIKNNIFEQLIQKIVEPFSIVYIDYISNIMKLSTEEIEAKLSQMILDKKLNGVLDQETQTFNSITTQDSTQLVASINTSMNELEDTITVLANRINNYSKKLQSL